MRLAPFVLFCGFVGFTASAQNGDLAAGKLLVSSKALGDPNFAETVVLLIRVDNEAGAVGLVINRRSDVPISKAFENSKSAKHRNDPLYLGGPVQPEAVLALVRSAAKIEDAKRIFGDVYMIYSQTLLEKTLGSGVEAGKLRVYLGYAGWGPGQLENEIEMGGWHVMQGDASSVFHADPDSLWQQLIRRTETQIAGRWPKTTIRGGFGQDCKPCSMCFQ